MWNLVSNTPTTYLDSANVYHIEYGTHLQNSSFEWKQYTHLKCSLAMPEMDNTILEFLNVHIDIIGTYKLDPIHNDGLKT